jgi:hypothetical protein
MWGTWEVRNRKGPDESGPWMEREKGFEPDRSRLTQVRDDTLLSRDSAVSARGSEPSSSPTESSGDQPKAPEFWPCFGRRGNGTPLWESRVKIRGALPNICTTEIEVPRSGVTCGVRGTRRNPGPIRTQIMSERSARLAMTRSPASSTSTLAKSAVFRVEGTIPPSSSSKVSVPSPVSTVPQAAMSSGQFPPGLGRWALTGSTHHTPELVLHSSPQRDMRGAERRSPERNGA